MIYCGLPFFFFLSDRSCRQPEEEMEKRSTWLNDSQEMKKDDQSQLKAGLAVSVQNIGSVHKNQSDTSRRRDFDEESLESFSSMPDPVDPTTVTKTFKSRKASAQASLASKDKTPKSKSKRKSSSQLKGRIKNTGRSKSNLRYHGKLNLDYNHYIPENLLSINGTHNNENKLLKYEFILYNVTT